ncbi:MAG: hypothetical protein WDZ49_03535 [Litorilinea sp.]
MFGTKLRQFLSAVLLERPGRRKTLVEWPVALTASGERLVARVVNAQGDEARNREVLSHVVGIERWCQRRLRTFLGQPPVRDEYDGYRPGATASLAEQLAAFRAARADTIALVQELAEALPEPDEATVDHNQYGPLSVYAWIRYLDLHANWEARRIR